MAGIEHVERGSASANTQNGIREEGGLLEQVPACDGTGKVEVVEVEVAVVEASAAEGSRTPDVGFVAGRTSID